MWQLILPKNKISKTSQLNKTVKIDNVVKQYKYRLCTPLYQMPEGSNELVIVNRHG